MIDQERLTHLPALAQGHHIGPRWGMCVMEAVSHVTGEEFTDQPACVCPIIAAVARHVNDNLPDDQRQRLIGYIPRFVGTARDDDTEWERRNAALRFAESVVDQAAPLSQRRWRLEQAKGWSPGLHGAVSLVLSSDQPRLLFGLLDAVLAVEAPESAAETVITEKELVTA